MMDPHAIADAANANASRAFELKDLFKSIIATSNPGPLPNAFDAFEDQFDTILACIGDMRRTPTIQDQSDLQTVYEAFSNFAEGIFELTDGLVTNSTRLVQLEPANRTRLPAATKALSGVVDAYCYAISAVLPAGSSYDRQTNNQKTQIDAHFGRVAQTFNQIPTLSPAIRPVQS